MILQGLNRLKEKLEMHTRDTNRSSKKIARKKPPSPGAPTATTRSPSIPLTYGNTLDQSVSKTKDRNATSHLSERQPDNSTAQHKWTVVQPSMCGLRMSTFSGSEDDILASDWIDLFDSIASDCNWSDCNKLIRLGGYLRGHALRWYVGIIKVCNKLEVNAWSSLKDGFVQRFSPHQVLTSPRSTKSTLSSDSSLGASDVNSAL